MVSSHIDGCALVLPTIEDVEIAYRLWAGNKVDEKDIKTIRKLKGAGWNMKIGDITPIGFLPKEYRHNPIWENCFVLRNMALFCHFKSVLTRHVIALEALESFYKRYPEPWMVTHE